LTGRYGFGLYDRDTQSLELSWEPEVRWGFSSGGRLSGVGRVRFQSESGMQLPMIQLGGYSSMTKPVSTGDSVEIELRELFYENQIGDWYLVFGKQQIVWGKSDGLKVLDVVDPQSYREFILEDFEQSRIPLWTLNLEQTFNDWTMQLLWLPDQTYHALPKPDATYAFSSPRLVPQAVPGVAVQLRQPMRPNDVIADSDAGIRMSGFVDGWDLSLNYLYQYDNQPALHQQLEVSSSPVVVLTPRYHRTHVLGGSFSRAFGDWVTRAELGYFTEHYFLTRNPSVVDGVARSEELNYVLGLDWSGMSDTFISAQLFQSWLPGYDGGIVRPRLDTSTTFLIRRNLNNDTLTIELLWIANANDGDGLVRPKISYDLEDNIRIWSGLDIFYGNQSGLFGQFDKNDRILLGVELGF